MYYEHFPRISEIVQSQIFGSSHLKNIDILYPENLLLGLKAYSFRQNILDLAVFILNLANCNNITCTLQTLKSTLRYFSSRRRNTVFE